MTTAVLDPAATIATAVRELVDSVRQLVADDTDDPGVLDELSRLIGRARRKVNKATKASAEPAPIPAAAKPAAPSSAAATPAVPSRPTPAAASPSPAPASIPVRPRSVTLPIPNATPTRTPPPLPKGTAVHHPATAAAHRRPAWLRPVAVTLLALVVLAAILLLAGCGSTPASSAPAPAAATSVTSSKALDPAIQIKCSKVEQAYMSWYWEPSRTPNYLRIGARVHLLMDSGKDFYDTVKGYPDDAARDLAAAVAQYNYDLAVHNARLTIQNAVDPDEMQRVTDGVGTITGKYASFKYATCR